MSPETFRSFQQLLLDQAGILLKDDKQTMVSNRLSRRVRALSLSSYCEYYEYICSHRAEKDDELQYVVDRLTTHKTYFFREPQHFDLLRDEIAPGFKMRPLAVWSSACSSGEEVYSIASVLADVLGLGGPWHVLGTDISKTEVEKARTGLYFEEQTDSLPELVRARYFNEKISDEMSGSTFTISSELAAHTCFDAYNLVADAPKHEAFDIIFIRNVLIYFDVNRRKMVLEKMLNSLRPGGYLFTGRSETVMTLIKPMHVLIPSVFQKEG